MKPSMSFLATGLLVWAMAATAAPAPTTPPAGPVRARDLGIPFDGKPGALNAITDVAGVLVGQATVIASPDERSEVRTGVTAILPRGRDSAMVPVFAGAFALNGNGE